MGDVLSCTSRKEPLDEAARVTQKEEEKLGYSDKKIRELEYAFKKYEVNGRLTRDQLQSSLKFVKLVRTSTAQE